MRKVLLFLTAFLTVLFSSNLTADVVPEDSHEVEKILMIEDTEELKIYPGATVYGYHTGGKADKAAIYEVRSGTELTKGYKFNNFYLYWALDDHFDLSSFTYDIDSDKPLSHPELKLLSDEINPGNYYIDEDNPLIREKITYKVYYDNPIIRIYKSKTVKTYDDDTPQEIEEFSPDGTNVTADNSNNSEIPDENEEQDNTTVEISDNLNQTSGSNEVDIGGCSILLVE
jgi:hypothetical protein